MADLNHQRQSSHASSGATTAHRCRQCLEHLRLVRRSVRPDQLGVPMTTEFYLCAACDFACTLDVVTGKWRPWAADS